MDPLKKRRKLAESSIGHREQRLDDRSLGKEEGQKSAPEQLPDNRSSPEEEARVWKICLAFRLLNALLVRTYFNPDEHWQALEVAHRMVFGYGHLTWEWERNIRSYLHPLVFAALYKLLALARMDTPLVMARAPRLLQAFFAAVGDLYLFKLSFRLFGRRAACWTMFCQVVNWFTFFCMVRTLSNSLETSLTIMGLFYWSNGPEELKTTHRRSCGWLTSRQLALIIAALSCVIRPTNGVVWLYVGVIELIQTRGKFQFLLAEVLPIGGLCLGLATLVDRWWFGYWTVVPVNFLKFNFLSSGGDFYGTHPWHWYFSQGFPVMVFTFLPLSAAGMWWAKERSVYSILIGWVLSIYSLLGHKEFRFVLPVLPLALMFAGYGLSQLEKASRAKKSNQAKELSYSQPRAPKEAINETYNRVRSEQESAPWFWWIIFGLLVTNVPVALYTSLIHQRGSEAVAEYLAKEAYHDRVDSVLFLMPCHSTPFYSSIHKNVTLRLLDCSPSDEASYVDEADRFKSNPMQFLLNMFPPDEADEGLSSLPSHVVLFDSTERNIRLFLEKHHYRLDKKLFHAHVPVDRELQAYVLVFSRKSKR